MTAVDWDQLGREATAAINVLKSAAAAVKTTEQPKQPQRVAICAAFHNAARMYAADRGWPEHRWFYASATNLRGWGGPILCLNGCENRRDADAVHLQIRIIRSRYGPADAEPPTT